MPDVSALASGANLSVEQARHLLGIPSDRIVVLAFGVLDIRKGIGPLLEALGNPACPPSVTVLLAGEQRPGIRELLAHPRNQELRGRSRIIEIPGFLNDWQEVAAFRAADIVWIGYQGFYGMSGILVSAAKSGVPVIACREGLLGWLTEKYQVGEVVDVGNNREVVSAIGRLANDKDLRARYAAAALAMGARHSSEDYGDTICDLATAKKA